MAKVQMTRGKFAGINACADERGVIAAAAMDQRGSLKKAIAKGRGENGPAINRIKYAFIERIGAECAALDVPFFLEPLAYDDEIGDEKSFAFAKVKPKYVAAYMAEFSQPRYGVDVLKVEVPVNMKYVAGTRAFGGEAAYTRQEALGLFREAAA